MSSSAIQPVGLSLTAQQQLQIDWSDGQRRLYDPAQLRRNCPCATCQTERHQRGAREEPAVEAPVSVRQMEPVGNYAYRITFSDSHSTGIFPLELLRELGEEVK